MEQVGEELVGQARCPFESGQSNVGLFAGESLCPQLLKELISGQTSRRRSSSNLVSLSGGDFYSATMTDFLASDAVIYRSLGEGQPVLRTVKYDSKWLRGGTQVFLQPRAKCTDRDGLSEDLGIF